MSKKRKHTSSSTVSGDGLNICVGDFESLPASKKTKSTNSSSIVIYYDKNSQDRKTQYYLTDVTVSGASSEFDVEAQFILAFLRCQHQKVTSLLTEDASRPETEIDVNKCFMFKAYSSERLPVWFGLLNSSTYITQKDELKRGASSGDSDLHPYYLVMKALISNKKSHPLDLMFRNSSDETILHLLVRHTKFKMDSKCLLMKELMNYQVEKHPEFCLDVNAKNAKNQTALHSALIKRDGASSMVSIFFEGSAKFKTLLTADVSSIKNTEASLFYAGGTILHYVVYFYAKEILKQKASQKTKQEKKHTGLMAGKLLCAMDAILKNVVVTAHIFAIENDQHQTVLTYAKKLISSSDEDAMVQKIQDQIEVRAKMEAGPIRTLPQLDNTLDNQYLNIRPPFQPFQRNLGHSGHCLRVEVSSIGRARILK